MGIDKDAEKESKVQVLMELAARHAKYFIDVEDSSKIWAWINVDEHFETMPLGTKKASLWLTNLYYNQTLDTVGSETVKSAQDHIAANLLFDDPAKKNIRKLNIRVAQVGDSILYDPCDMNWRAVKIDSEGVQIVQQESPVFKRYQGMQEQKVNLNVDYDALGSLCRAMGVDGDYGLLYKVYLVTSFLPEVPHPLLILIGDHGSGKTTLSTITKQIVDPAALSASTLHTEVLQLMQVLQHNYFIVFDNCNDLRQYLSDMMCKACTGDSISKRQLYTDEDDVTFKYRRCIAMNGINLPSTSGDFIDRAIIFKMNRIKANQRRTEAEIWAEFEKIRPDIVGQCFDVLSKALRIKDEVQIELKSLPRMADFAVYGEATARVLGYEKFAFLNAYNNLLAEYDIDVIEQYSVMNALLQYLDEKKLIDMSVALLLSELNDYAEQHRIPTKNKYWPKDAARLGKIIRRVRPNLENLGHDIEFYRSVEKGNKGQRCVKIARNQDQDAVEVSSRAGDSSDTSDSKIGTFWEGHKEGSDVNFVPKEAEALPEK